MNNENSENNNNYEEILAYKKELISKNDKDILDFNKDLSEEGYYEHIASYIETAGEDYDNMEDLERELKEYINKDFINLDDKDAFCKIDEYEEYNEDLKNKLNDFRVGIKEYIDNCGEYRLGQDDDEDDWSDLVENLNKDS